MPISSAWRCARRRQPRIISWITTAISTTSTAAKISDPISVPEFMRAASAFPDRTALFIVAGAVHAGLFPSAVTLPRSRVAVTVAGRVIDSYGVLADRLASAGPVTVHVASGSTTVRLAGSPTSSGRP